MGNPFMQYKQQSVNTLTSGELIIKLYDEAYKDLMRASMFYKEEKFEEADSFGEKAKAIFLHLMNVLDFEIPISQNLYQLYLFFNQQIINAQIRRKSATIDDILPLIADLKNTWTQAEKLVHINK